ncbi:hypothetical protein DMB38_08195 [Streptomyces sp. WAC 06738]|uniref:hypothetical protein n=1 Tax=Streptomyces sp. WAC 06738 TaxID=2203210 RepID=UPI000F6DB8BA|nr:hypothetical protein [Streptomyces sp. WAC 06738]AZM45815.1 hypothetical protein DMB38_08195 [Streptomyces sp. WAC 06738]
MTLANLLTITPAVWGDPGDEDDNTDIEDGDGGGGGSGSRLDIMNTAWRLRLDRRITLDKPARPVG